MDEKTRSQRDSDADALDHTAERDDAAEPDAPTAVEENEGLSTVLSGEPARGVQDNASEK
jgi:hypothetical protein